MTIEDHVSDLDSRIQKLLDRWEIASTEGKLEKILEIRRWLTNFKASELEDMFLLLEKLEVISEYEIQTLLKSLAKKFKNIFRDDFSKVRFFDLGNFSSSSGGNFLYTLCKYLGDIPNCFPDHPHQNSQSLIVFPTMFLIILFPLSGLVRMPGSHCKRLQIKSGIRFGKGLSNIPARR